MMAEGGGGVERPDSTHRNGSNFTESVNGAGNLVIGYDEANTSARVVCSLATDINGNPLTSESTCLSAGGAVAVREKNGSHNLVMGSQNSYSSAGGIIAGRGNFITALHASKLPRLPAAAAMTRALPPRMFRAAAATSPRL